MPEKFLIRLLDYDDCEIISQAFTLQNWSKPKEQYVEYLREQKAGKRTVLVAEKNGEFAGYLTIVWQSDFPQFFENNIPEIVDFNVLIKFRNQGIGNLLMNEAENLAAEGYETVGIRVGLTGDYGAAQRMYAKRGYIPDGLGISQNGKPLFYGDQITIDDELVLSFTKRVELT
mgnify:CR=1 FL=1